MPKGVWYGEAVTGGFFSHIPNNVSVGAGFYPARPGLYRTSRKGVIARPVRKLVVAIRTPVLIAPLPKGGWHGEAVTGGYISAPHSLCPKMLSGGSLSFTSERKGGKNAAKTNGFGQRVENSFRPAA